MTTLRTLSLLASLPLLSIACASAGDTAGEHSGRQDEISPAGVPGGEVIAYEELRVTSSGLVCITWPCPVFTVTDSSGAQMAATDLDLSALDLPDEVGGALAMQVYEEDGLKVLGEIVAGPTGPAGEGTTVRVVGTFEAPAEYVVRSSGVVCRTWPCPSIELETADGSVRVVTDLDLSSLGLSQPEIDLAMEKVFGDGLSVEGEILNGWPVGPAGHGTTLKVTDLLDARN